MNNLKPTIMKNMKKILTLGLLMNLGFSSLASDSKVQMLKSKLRKEIRRQIQIPVWMTKEMKQERVEVIFIINENGKPELKRVRGDNEKLCAHVKDSFSRMELDTTVMLNDTEYMMKLEFDVR
ncbi:MAG: hypothetical protein RLZZ46_1140 [Bacteroidota bacterium]|jgi:hypothetical protein